MAHSNSFRSNWGFLFFSALSLLGFARLLNQTFPGHYKVYEAATAAFWNGGGPYGTDFGTGIGHFFYSPSSLISYFSLFTFLPEKLGLALYMAVSWTIFVWGVQRITTQRLSPPVLNWFWFAITPQIVGGLLASKLEIAITGFALLGAALLLEKGWKPWLGAFLYAMIVNWKLQPLPAAGLLMLTWFTIQRDLKLPIFFLLSLIAWYALPFCFKPSGYLIWIHEVWSESLQSFAMKAWQDFENIFAFASHTLGFGMTFESIRWISLGTGAALAGAVWIWVQRWKREISHDELLEGGILLSLALGFMFICVLSPLGQNNALILYAPLLCVGFLSFENMEGAARARWGFFLVAIWAAMTLSYSDVVPVMLRNQLRHMTVKPFVMAVFGFAILTYWFSRGWQLKKR